MATPDVLATDAGGYPSGPPWQYLLTLLWMFIPPFSLVAIAAMVRGGRRLPLYGLPALAFVVGHSLIANKQERFLLPVLPVLAMLAGAGFADVRAWFARRGWSPAYRGLWAWAVGVNALLLMVSVFTYGKKDRVAPLVVIERRHDATGVIVAEYAYTFKVPAYYLGRPRPPLTVLTRRDSLPADAARLRDSRAPAELPRPVQQRRPARQRRSGLRPVGAPLPGGHRFAQPGRLARPPGQSGAQQDPARGRVRHWDDGGARPLTHPSGGR